MGAATRYALRGYRSELQCHVQGENIERIFLRTKDQTKPHKRQTTDETAA